MRGGHARRILLSAWSDLEYGFNEWAVYKAYVAGLMASRAALPGVAWAPGSDSLAYSLAGLSRSCRGLSEVIECSSLVDALALPLDRVELIVDLGIEALASRGDALGALECVLKAIEYMESCERPRWVEPVDQLMGRLRILHEPLEEASLIGLRGFYILASDEFRGLSYRRRITVVEDRLPPARVALLSPEEAFTLLQTHWRPAPGEEPEVHRDDYLLVRGASSV